MNPPVSFTYDLFVSCAPSDRAWVEGYLLPALGLSSERVVTPRNFTPGAVVSDEFQRAVTGSRFTLLVLSPAYFADVWAVHSAQMVSYLTVEEQRNRLIPLEREKSELPLDIKFRVRLDCTDKDNWEASVAKLRELLNQPEPEPERIPCPYPGMIPFGINDARTFCGRDKEIDELEYKVKNQRYLFVIGPSGSGKSSLVFAGLVAGLQLSQPGQWLLCTMRPSAAPLKAAVLSITEEKPLGSFENLDVSQLLANYRPAKRLLLVIDQFEELFTQSARSTQTEFIARLKVLREIANCTLVIAMRADFFAELMTSDLWQPHPLDPSERIEVAPLRGEALKEAIVKPAERAGVYLEAGLLEMLMRDAADEPGVLPLMQETMSQLWEKRAYRLLTKRAYELLGQGHVNGLAAAISAKADAVYANLQDEPKRAIARRIFLRLIQFGEGRSDTRRQQTEADLLRGNDPLLFDQTLGDLIDHRLLTASGDEKSARKIDISHEALISGWPRLQEWIKERRTAEQTRRRLEDKVREWVRLGSGDGGLLDPVELAEAEQWLSSPDAADLGCGDLPALVQASRAAIKRVEQEKEAVRQRELEQAQSLAEERRVRLVETQRLRSLTVAQGLAAQANYELYQKPQRSLLLAVESVRIALEADDGWLPAALQALRNALSATGGILLHGHEKAVSSVAFSPSGRLLASGGHDRTVRLQDLSDPNVKPTVLHGHEHVVSCVAFSPDSQLLASSSGDRTIRIWDLADLKAEPVILLGHEGPVFSIAFSPNGRLLASGSRDQKVRLWDTADLKAKPVILRGHSDSVTTVAFSPNGRFLAAGCEDQAIYVWRVANPKAKPVVLRGHESTVTSVAFSPNGQLLAAGCEDQAIRMWRMANLKAKPVILHGHQSAVRSVAFSPSGQLLASGGGDHTLRIWDTADLKSEPVVLFGHEGSVTNISFSPSGASLASASEDHTLRLWDTAQPRSDPFILLGHEDFVRSVASSPNGQLLASGSADRTVRLWDMANPKSKPVILRGHGETVRSLAFSPNNQLLASGGRDHKVFIWDIENPVAEPITLRGINGPVSSVAFDPNGRLLAAGNWDRMVYLWEMSNLMADPVTLAGHEDSVFSIAFSPDGLLIASGGRDQTVCLWDSTNLRTAPIVLSGHVGPVYSLAFSPNGQLLASGGEDQTIRVWDTADLVANPIVLSGHMGPIYSVDFSPDSRLLVSASRDQTVRLWNTLHLKADPVILSGHAGSVFSVVFTLDGRLLASVGNDRTVRLWNMSMDRIVGIACTVAGRNLTHDEWRQYFGDEPYHPTCPDLPGQ